MINIVLCMKVVLSNIVCNDNNVVDKYMLNPYDLYALEQLLELKKTTECKITCLCMGKDEIMNVLVQCKAMGADDIILLSDPNFAGADTFATTYVLSQAIKTIDYDIVVCGKQAIDGETGQVPYGLAVRLNCICISNTINIEMVKSESLIVNQQKDNNRRKIAIRLPVVITYNDFTLKRPRINLLALKRAQAYKINIRNAQDMNLDINKVGQKGSKTEVYSGSKLEYKKAETIYIDGEIDERIEKVNDILHIYKERMGRRSYE